MFALWPDVIRVLSAATSVFRNVRITSDPRYQTTACATRTPHEEVMRPVLASIIAPAPRAGASPLHRAAAAVGCLSLVLAAAGCHLAGGSAAANTSGEGTIKVAVVPGIENATLDLAQHEGLFTNAGIKVQIVRYASISQEMSALNNGVADIACGDYGNIFFAQASSPSPVYRIITDGYDATPGVLEIMTLPGSRLSSPTQLGGKHIAVPNNELVATPKGAPDSLAVAAAGSVLQSFVVNMSGVHWDPMAPLAEISALAQHRVQAILVAEPYITIAQRELGAVQLIDAFSGATAGLPLVGYFSTNAWATKNGDAITAFRSAMEQAAADASMPGPVQAILPKYANLTRQQSALVTIGSYPTSTIVASLQRTADLLWNVGVLRYRLNVAKMIAP
jgi:NitT/TauT family transport system substrate-binding protein